MTVIDLHIGGDPASIYNLADWLSDTGSTTVTALKDRLNKTSGESAEFWSGRTGDGFRESLTAAAKATEPVAVFASDVAEVFRAYARRLERGRIQFDGYLADASASALIVDGEIITHPMPPKTYISKPGTPAPIEYGPGGECIIPMSGEEYARALSLHDQISRDVGKWWGELENWINEYLVPLMARATDFDLLNQVFETMKLGNDYIAGVPLALTEGKWKEYIGHYETLAKKAQLDADDYYRKNRSGNPKINGAVKGVTKQELQGISDALSERVRQFEVGTKIITKAGVVIDIVTLAADVSNGGSLSSGLIGTLSGIVASGGAGVIVSSTALSAAPPVAVAVALALLAAAASHGATQAWENNVPLDIREAIDAGDFDYVFK